MEILKYANNANDDKVEIDVEFFLLIVIIFSVISLQKTAFSQEPISIEKLFNFQYHHNQQNRKA